MTQPDPRAPINGQPPKFPAVDPRYLIKAATPLPWTHGRTHWRRQQSDWWGIFAPASGRLPMLSMPPKAVAYLEDERIDHADAALVVYAVNNLPALLDVAEALQQLADAATALENRAIRSSGEFHVWAEERMLTDARDEAREALARLKESTDA